MKDVYDDSKLASFQRRAILTSLQVFLLAGYAFAQDYAVPGTCASVLAGSSDCEAMSADLSKSSSTTSLAHYTTKFGKLIVSIDAIGSDDRHGAFLQVQKPSEAATVRAAYLMTASTGFLGNMISNVTITRGANSLTVAPNEYDKLITSSIFSQTGIEDVSAFIAADLDPELAGTYDYLVVEGSSPDLNGEVLVVIFDEPSATPSTFVLMFGAQDVTGDSFDLTLPDPFDDALVDITMSLGISYGFQLSSGHQHHLVEINSQRLTTAAGGQDDCDVFNPPENTCAISGATMTVGGLGDDPANPADPFALATDARSDDEFYTLDPFLQNGDTKITIFTEDPLSRDDNLFFAGFYIKNRDAVFSEAILLTPPDDTSPINSRHTVTAFLHDDDGNQIAGRDVHFEVVSGPNAGLTAIAATDVQGEATFSWISASAGTDVVEASFVSSSGQTLSTSSQTTWEAVECDIPRIGGQRIDQTRRTITLVYEDADGIARISYRYPSDFPDPEKAGRRALRNAFVSDDGGLSSSNGVDFIASAPYPTLVTHVLQARGPRRVVFFPLITDACGDPGPQQYDADPVHEFPDEAVEPPIKLLLDGPFPNPFNPTTTVRLSLPENEEVTVEVYDVLGRRVATPLEQTLLSAGAHEVGFDASGLAAGTYVLRVAAGEYVETIRLILAK